MGGVASWGIRRPLLGSALASLEQSVAACLLERCWWLPLIEWVPCNSFVREALAVAYDTTRVSHRRRQLMMPKKNHQWATRSSRALDKNLHNTKAEDLKRSTGVIPAKYPLTVKLEKSLVHNSRVLERGKIMPTLICKGIGVFIVVESWHLLLGLEVFSL